jgi:hypothetical protein
VTRDFQDEFGAPVDADNVILPDGTELTGAIAPGGDELTLLRVHRAQIAPVEASVEVPSELIDALDKVAQALAAFEEDEGALEPTGDLYG